MPSPSSFAERCALNPRFAFHESADGRPDPGQPIRLRLGTRPLATRGHAVLALSELDQRRLEERIDPRPGHAVLALSELDQRWLEERIDPRPGHAVLALSELDQRWLEERIDPRPGHVVLALSELDQRWLEERIDPRPGHLVLALSELDQRWLEERIDPGADVAPGRRSCDEGRREDHCGHDGHDDQCDEERPAEDVRPSARFPCPCARLDQIHCPASCLAPDRRHDFARRGLAVGASTSEA
jgi:hypothetical protein